MISSIAEALFEVMMESTNRRSLGTIRRTKDCYDSAEDTGVRRIELQYVSEILYSY